MRILLRKEIFWVVVLLVIGVVALSHTSKKVMGVVGANSFTLEGLPHRILLDTDVDTDDLFALLYLLKQNRSEFNVEVSSDMNLLNVKVEHAYTIAHYFLMLMLSAISISFMR
jgi:hypothetical protein